MSELGSCLVNEAGTSEVEMFFEKNPDEGPRSETKLTEAEISLSYQSAYADSGTAKRVF